MTETKDAYRWTIGLMIVGVIVALVSVGLSA